MNPETPALLRLTLTPSTNASVQVNERNGGADDGPSEILTLPAPENSTKNSNSENSKNSNSKQKTETETVIMTKHGPALVSSFRTLNPNI